MERIKVILQLIRMEEGKKKTHTENMGILDGGSCGPVKNLKVNI